MASYPYELAQDAVYQSHTSRLTELWSLPRPAQGLNTSNKKGTRKLFYEVPDWLMHNQADTQWIRDSFPGRTAPEDLSSPFATS